jgi:hypothetical protein
MKNLWTLLLCAAPLCGCNVALGLENLKGGPDPSAPDAEPSDHGQCPVAPGGGSCVVYPACGCSANENCARINGGPEECVTAGTAAGLGSCVDETDCRPGLLCADNVCDPPCSGSCPTANFDCLAQDRALPDGGDEALGYSVCEPHCNPVAPQTGDGTHAACGQGQRCDPSSSGNGVTVCNYPAGSGVQGTACSSRHDCAPGYDCHSPEGQSSRCERYCDYGAAATCPGGTTCFGFPMPLFDRSQPVGLCE